MARVIAKQGKSARGDRSERKAPTLPSLAPTTNPSSLPAMVFATLARRARPTAVRMAGGHKFDPLMKDPAIEKFMAMREDMYKGFKFNRKTMPTVIISLIILPVSVWAIADYDLRHDFTMSAIPRGLQDGWYKDELTEEQLKDNYIGNDIGLFDPKLFEGKLAGPTLGQIYRHQRKVHQDPEASS